MTNLAIELGTPGRALIDPIAVRQESVKGRNRRIEVAGSTVSLSDTPGLARNNVALDTEWMKLAAPHYDVSSDIKDYVMVPVILFYADVPNRNGLGFLLKDLVDFDMDRKMPRYKSWKGCPIHIEHDNKNPKKAAGMVLDSIIRKKVHAPIDLWKVIAYLALDRGKYKDTADKVMSGESSSYSMGSYIDGGYVCSICEKTVCNHIRRPTKKSKPMSLIQRGTALAAESADGPNAAELVRGRPILAFAAGRKPVGFEVSVVEKPAFGMAYNDRVMYF